MNSRLILFVGRTFTWLIGGLTGGFVGYFFAASAFRHDSVATVGTAIASYTEGHGVSAFRPDGGPVAESTDVLLYGSRGGWIPVMWPEYFNIHDLRACVAVSKALNTLAVTVNVYDDDFWSFEVLSSGGLIDKAAPRADYFAEDEESATLLRQRWQGNPVAAAAALAVPVDLLRPYYAYLGPEDAPGKAFPDDEFPLENFWVFVDMWRRIGITYPADPNTFADRLRLAKNFNRKLPTWEGEDL